MILIVIGGLVIATLQFMMGGSDAHYDDDEPDEPEPAPETDTVECIYCGTIYDKHLSQCPYCSAPHTRHNVLNVGESHGS